MLSDGSSVGAAITTRNRSKVLEIGLAHFKEFSKKLDRLVVVDDCSDEEERVIVRRLLEDFPIPVVYRESEVRLGISKAKNACLAAMQDLDHVFLFDDDAWPVQEDWEEWWVQSSLESGIHHTMWMADCDKYPNANLDGLRAVVRPAQEIGEKLVAYTNCLGLLMYCSRHCLNLVGGFDPDFPNVYGYEHAQFSHRCRMAGVTSHFDYVTLKNCEEYIYSLDIMMNWLGKSYPLMEETYPPVYPSSVTPEEAQAHPQNGGRLNSNQVHIPLVDPLGVY